MAKRGENIYLRKDGRWEGRYIKGRKWDGKPSFGYIYGRKYIEVKQKLTLLKVQFAKQPDMVRIYGNGTVAEWMDYWLEKLTRPYIGETTYYTYKTQIKTHIVSRLGAVEIGKLQPNDIQDLVNGKKDSLSAGMLHNIHRLLRSAMRAAHEKGLIRDNPCVGIKLPRNRAKTPRVLTRNEQQKLERTAVKKGAIEYLLCLYTGLRLGELCALKWSDVNFETGALYVRGTMKRIDGKAVIGAPKSGNSEREVPVPAFVLKMLRIRIKQTGGNGFVFGTGGKAASMRTMQARLKALTKGIGLEGVHMHTLRHTYATRCLENRIGMETLSDLLGHSGPQITLKYYAHCTRENKFASVRKLKAIAC